MYGFLSKYLVIIEWDSVGYKEFCRSARVLLAFVDNTTRDLLNSSYPSKAESNNCFIIHSKYFPVLKRSLAISLLCFCSPKITQSCPQVFSLNGSLTCSGLHFRCHFDVTGLIWQNFWHHRFNMTKFFPYSVNSNWLWQIMCVVSTNQKQRDILNE